MSLRRFEASDRAYVIRTWVMSAKPAASPTRDYYRAKGPTVEGALVGARVVVACVTETPEVIVGFAVVDDARETVHYSTVRHAWIGQGIHAALMGAACGQESA